MKSVILAILLTVAVLLSSPFVVLAQVPPQPSQPDPAQPTQAQVPPADSTQQQPQQQAPTAVPPTTAPTRAVTGAIVPTHISTATCDACGYCNGMKLEEVPGGWQSCRQCIYGGFGPGELNPLDNKTIQGTQAGIPTPDLYHVSTDFGCLSTRPNEFANQLSSFFFSVVGGIAFLFFIYGSGIIATSRSDPGKLNHGKRVIYGSIIGLLFALFSVFIIRFIATGIGLPNIGG